MQRQTYYCFRKNYLNRKLEFAKVVGKVFALNKKRPRLKFAGGRFSLDSAEAFVKQFTALGGFVQGFPVAFYASTGKALSKE